MEQEEQPAAQQLGTPEFSPRPQQMMGFMDALTTVFRNKYATFSGRASRSEYWWSYLGIAVISMVLQIIGIVGGLALGSVNEGLGALFGLAAFAGLLALLIPSLAVNVRRLHDTGKSGWMLLILLIPCIGFILWLVWMIEDGQPHVNAYGAVPTNSLD